jgi:hypothetical protein
VLACGGSGRRIRRREPLETEEGGAKASTREGAAGAGGAAASHEGKSRREDEEDIPVPWAFGSQQRPRLTSNSRFPVVWAGVIGRFVVASATTRPTRVQHRLII